MPCEPPAAEPDLKTKDYDRDFNAEGVCLLVQQSQAESREQQQADDVLHEIVRQSHLAYALKRPEKCRVSELEKEPAENARQAHHQRKLKPDKGVIVAVDAPS